MKKDKLTEKIKQGLYIINLELKQVEYFIKIEKDPILKKSLINRRSFLKYEYKLGKQYLKKNS